MGHLIGAIDIAPQDAWRFPNAMLGDLVIYTSNAYQNIVFGTMPGSNSPFIVTSNTACLIDGTLCNSSIEDGIRVRTGGIIVDDGSNVFNGSLVVNGVVGVNGILDMNGVITNGTFSNQLQTQPTCVTTIDGPMFATSSPSTFGVVAVSNLTSRWGFTACNGASISNHVTLSDRCVVNGQGARASWSNVAVSHQGTFDRILRTTGDFIAEGSLTYTSSNVATFVSPMRVSSNAVFTTLTASNQLLVQGSNDNSNANSVIVSSGLVRSKNGGFIIESNAKYLALVPGFSSPMDLTTSTIYASNLAWQWTTWGSNSLIHTSNTALFASNAATFSSNVVAREWVAWGSNTLDWTSNAARYASNVVGQEWVAWGSNAATFSSNVVAREWVAWGSNTLDWSSNAARYASNVVGQEWVAWGSNAVSFSSNVVAREWVAWGSNTLDWTSNAAMYASNVVGQEWVAWGSNALNWTSNAANFGSNAVLERTFNVAGFKAGVVLANTSPSPLAGIGIAFCNDVDRIMELTASSQSNGAHVSLCNLSSGSVRLIGMTSHSVGTAIQPILSAVSNACIIEHPPAPLTSPEISLSNLPYGNGPYVVTSSSSNPIMLNTDAYYGFNKTNIGDTQVPGWASIPNAYSLSGGAGFPVYGTSASTLAEGSNVQGEWLQIKLPSPIAISSYTITPFRATLGMPRSWMLLASSNDGSTWKNLHGSYTIPNSNAFNTQSILPLGTSFNVRMNTEQSLWQLYRIVVTSVVVPSNPSSTTTGTYVCQFQMFSAPQTGSLHTSRYATSIMGGALGVGTAWPQQMLDVRGSCYVTSNIGIGTNVPNYNLHLIRDSAMKPGSSTWTTTSDERLKEDIVTADEDRCYDIVRQLPLRRFSWRRDYVADDTVGNDRSKLGWIAQEVEHVFPKAVTRIDGMYGLPDCLTLNTDQVIAALYGCVKALQRRVEDLSDHVAA